MSDRQTSRFATLTQVQEDKLKEVEAELKNVYVIAYEKPLEPARLTEDQLEKLQEAEHDMPGVVLVAYGKR